MVLVVKNLYAAVGEAYLIPGSGRSPGEGHGNPLQYSYLENSGNLEVTVHGVTKSPAQLSNKAQHSTAQ